MRLYIARHAWAGHYGDPGWSDDSLRELTPDGIERYRRVAACLAERGVAPSKIATSPYARCRQTADLLAEGVPGDPPVEPLEALEPGVELRPLLEWTNRNTPDDLAWVGHNPDVERLVALLVSDRSAAVRFAKGSVAAIRFEDRVQRGEGVLEWHVTAKVLGC